MSYSDYKFYYICIRSYYNIYYWLKINGDIIFIIFSWELNFRVLQKLSNYVI